MRCGRMPPQGSWAAALLLGSLAVCLPAGPARAVQCDDGDPCTTDLAFMSACLHFEIAGCTACATDADCPDPDNDMCTGTYYCAGNHVCTLDTGSVVTCDQSLDTECRHAVCNPSTGQCALEATAGTCNDDDPCTINDTCQTGGNYVGQCVGTLDVGPGKTCECTKESGCGASEDGDLCNGTLYCVSGTHTCKVNPASVPVCDTSADTSCRKNQCVAALGQCQMTNLPPSTVCSDGDPCTINDSCAAGSCGGTPDIGIGETCECVSDADCAPLEDGDLCNGTFFCNKATHECLLNPATVVSCPSVNDTACSQNLCDPALGLCKITSVNGACDDGNECTINDTCTGGTCKGTTSIGAGEHCACQSDADCLAHFDDANACNGTLYCELATHECVVNPATVIDPGVACMQDADCPSGFHCAGGLQATSESGAALARLGVCTSCPSVDDSVCAVSTCNPTSGACQLAPLEDGADCATDGDQCTVGDHCFDGECVGTYDIGPGLTCECVQDGDCLDDGDLCNGVPYCDLSSPSPTCRTNPATVISCPSVDDSTCAKNRCQPDTGECVMTPEPGETRCTDDDPCTHSDHCEAGLCVGTEAGCECVTDADCADDGDLCNGVAYCDHSKVPWQCLTNPASVVTCADGDPTDCRERACDPATGVCEVELLDSGEPCTDGDICTGDDFCVAGACETGAPICGANAVCTLEAGGFATCECVQGWGPPGVCDTPSSTDPCDGVDAVGRCNGTDIEYCENGLLFRIECATYELLDRDGTPRVQEGSCIELDVGPRCVFQAGEWCATTSAHEVWGCGDDTQLAPDMGCDLTSGCAPGLGTCDPGDPSYVALPRCVGTVRVHECSSLGQPLGIDCSHPSVGEGSCVDGVCVDLVEGAVCAPGVFECASGLECRLASPQAPTGTCQPPEPVSSVGACLAVQEWLGDGYCDATANNPACGWDAGDCCASTCAPDRAYACGVAGFDCYDPDAPVGGGGTGAGCAAPSGWLADGYCDGLANNLECGWDGGDCCETTCVDAAYVCGTTGFECLDPAAGGGTVVPGAWSCTPEWYSAADGCDCACGVYDPDCADPGANLYRCPAEATGCSAQGSCVVPTDPPDETAPDAGTVEVGDDAGIGAPVDADAGAPVAPDAGAPERPTPADAGASDVEEPAPDAPDDPEEPAVEDPGVDESGERTRDDAMGCAAAGPGTTSVTLALLAVALIAPARRRAR